MREMNRLRRSYSKLGMVVAVALLLVTNYVSTAWSDQISSGFSFSQVDYVWSHTSQFLNSDTVQMDVNVGSFSSGYINVSVLDVSGTPQWVVQNLPIRPSQFDGNFTYPSISTNFGLGTAFGNTPGDNIPSLNAFVDFSATPLESFGGGPTSPFKVADVGYNAQGFGSVLAGGNLSNSPPKVVKFQIGGLINGSFQPNHPNVQAADNQCFPAAVANSLTWLKDSYGVNVPDPNVPGRGDPTTGKVFLVDDSTEGKSLVGKLDVTMNRNSSDRADGDPVEARPGLEGKLQYLGDNKLGWLSVNHQGELGDVNVTKGGVTSIGRGTTITARFLEDEIMKGEDVELGYLFAGGGHFVEVVGAGKILGIPWITYRSDHWQTARDAMGNIINDDKGTDGTDFSFLLDTDMDGSLNLVNEKGVPNAAFAISQSVPEPSTMLLLGSGLLGLAGLRKKFSIFTDRRLIPPISRT